jgi:signal transduction histidine kinase/DNA-binding response OmpR family regulator
MRVLVVEDEPTLCDVYQDFLHERGHEAVVARTAEAAIASLEQQPPDAVILDIHLPGMSGLDLLRLRVTHELGVPVIVISGYVSESQARECLALGASQFMGKPVSLERLGRALDSVTGSGESLETTPEHVERRSERRVAVTLPVRVVAADGREWTGRSVDLSVSGIRLRVPAGSTTPDVATLRLTLSEPVYLAVPSVAVRTGVDEHAYRFVDLSAEQRAQLSALVDPPRATSADVAPHLRIVQSIAEAASAGLEVEHTLAIALDALTHVTGHEISSLHLLSDDGRTLLLRGERGLSPALREVNQSLPVGEGLIGKVAATGEPRNVVDVSVDPDLLPAARDAVRAAGIGAFLSMPIRSHGRILGTVSIGRRSRRVFTAVEIAVVEASAHQLGLALENARLATEARQRLAELRTAEAQLAATARLSTIGQLAAGLAHEVSSPLGAILGQIELVLMRGGHSDDTRQRLGVVLEETMRVSRLLQSLLHVARPEPPARMACALQKEIDLVLALMAPQFRRDGIELRTEFSPTPAVWADAAQIRQVVLNLLHNADHAMARQRGPRLLTVRTRLAGDRVRLEIADTGPGIPAETLPRIFEAFFTTKPSGEGTGLGLWVSAGIVAAHEGRIWAESPAGGGATLIVELPIAR